MNIDAHEKRRASGGIGRSQAKAGRYFDQPNHDKSRMTSNPIAIKNNRKPVARSQMSCVSDMVTVPFRRLIGVSPLSSNNRRRCTPHPGNAGAARDWTKSEARRVGKKRGS